MDELASKNDNHEVASRHDDLKTTSESVFDSASSHVYVDDAQTDSESRKTEEDGASSGHGDHEDVESVRTVPAQGPLYSIFTRAQKRSIVAMAAISGFFSAVSANIYFPASNVLAQDFHVSAALINLTLTSYVIFQGFVPLLIGDLADTGGRRPAYIVCFTIYIGANVGLALCQNYASLLALRCIQSSGSAALIALGSGVVADIADTSERGIWMGFVAVGSSAAPALGPVLGGILSEYLGWRWIFWFLLILASVHMIPLATLFPETSRNVVGNGSIPPQGWNMSLLDYIQVRRAAQADSVATTMRTAEEVGDLPDRADGQEGEARTSQVRGEQGADVVARPRLKFPNPLHGLKLFIEKDIGLLLLYNLVVFVLYYTTLSTTPYLFAKMYGFSDLQVGLCFLPLGVGSVVALIINGNVLDWNFRRTSRRLGLTVDPKRATDLTTFPLERVRLQVAVPFTCTCAVTALVYGWIMDRAAAPLAPALILQFVIGVSGTAAFGALNVLLVDLQPKSPATVTAANNMGRCSVGAGATAVIISAIDRLGTGGVFTLTGGMLLACMPIAWVLVRKGPGWREERRVKVLRREEEAQARRWQRIIDTRLRDEKVQAGPGLITCWAMIYDGHDILK